MQDIFVLRLHKSSKGYLVLEMVLCLALAGAILHQGLKLYTLVQDLTLKQNTLLQQVLEQHDTLEQS